MKKTEEKVLRFIQSKSLVDRGDRVLVALSGGPDSVFLLYFLSKFKKKYKLDLAAFHLNHKLRDRNSDDDSKFCRFLCKNLNIPLYETARNVNTISKKLKISLEEAGRITRYRLLDEVCRKNDFTKIATAHIQDDNTETVLLNMIKGSGITGMTGIPVKRANIIRPVLCLTKEEILDYLHLNKISYRIDESNLSVDYERNFLRLNIIPQLKEKLNPSLDETIFNSSFVFKSFKDFLEKYVDKFLSEVVVKVRSGLIIDILKLKEYHNTVISESLRKSVFDNWNVNLNFNDIKRIISLISKQPGILIELSGNLVALKDRSKIILSKKKHNAPESKHVILVGQSINLKDGRLFIKPVEGGKINYNADPNIEYVAADNISEELLIRLWKNGDKFIPLGMKGKKKISDFLIDVKMSRLEKRNQYILADGDRIIWLIGKRINNRYRITDKTKKVLELCWKPKKN